MEKVGLYDFTDMRKDFVAKAEELKALNEKIQTADESEKESLYTQRKIAVEILTASAKRMNELIIFSLIKENDNFFGNIIIQLNRRIEFNYPAPAAVAYKNMYFDLIVNPLLCFQYDLDAIKAIYVHEVYHILNKHLMRALPMFKTYPQLILNLGMDCAINQYIEKLPGGSVSIRSLRDTYHVQRTLEREREMEYYIKELLLEYKENEEFKQEIDGRTKQSDSNGGGQGEQPGQGGPKPGEEGYDGRPGAATPGEGTGGGGEFAFDEDEVQGHKAWEQSDQSDNFESVDDTLRKLTNEAASRSRGRIPNDIREIMNKLNERPIINWKQQLRKYIGHLAKPHKKTITRKDRRQPHRCDVRGKLNDHVAEIVVAIDTSGSMDNKTIEYCMNEVFNIVKYNKSKITIVECDCRIGRVYEAKRPQDVKPEVTGRGGTSFTPVFEWLIENGKRNVVTIYFTDGYGEYELGCDNISYRTLWVLTGRSSELSLREPKGEVKELRLDEEWQKQR